MDHEDDDTGAVDGSIAPSIESIPLDQEEPQILSEHVQAGAGENGNVSLYNQPPIHTQMRLQLRQCFFDLHFGPNGVPPPLFVLVVQNTGSQMKAIEAAMDALCVAQLSTSTRDHRLGKMAAAHYLVAICHLNREMGRFNLLPAAHRRIDEIIKAIDVLISCSWFGCVEANPKDWIRHMQGQYDISTRNSITLTSNRSQVCLTLSNARDWLLDTLQRECPYMVAGNTIRFSSAYISNATPL